jgi:agmatinase
MVRPKDDLRNDIRCGFEIVKARDIDRYGVSGVIERLKSRVAGTIVYISVDIDVLDPAFAPGKQMIRTELLHDVHHVV